MIETLGVVERRRERSRIELEMLKGGTSWVDKVLRLIPREREEERGTALVKILGKVADVVQMDLVEVELTLRKIGRLEEDPPISVVVVVAATDVQSSESGKGGPGEEGLLAIGVWADVEEGEGNEVDKSVAGAAGHAGLAED